MSANKTVEELVSEIQTLNDELKAQLNNMELYVASARAKNWIGDADPIFQTFNDEIINYKTTVGHHLAFDAEKYAEAPQSRALSVLWGILGFEQRDNIKEELLNELHGRRVEQLRMTNSFKSMKKTTKKTEKYSEFEGSLPTTDSVLSLSDVLPMPYNSSGNISREIYLKAHDIELRSMFMNDRKAICKHLILPSVLVPNAFEVLRLEVDDLCTKHWYQSSTGNDSMREIGKRLVGMARRLAAIMKKYYDKELTYEFAAFASDRFRAIYLLVQSISSLYRGILLLERNPFFILCREEDASGVCMTFQDFKHGCGSEERHMIKGLSDQLQMFLQMCLIFSDSTEITLSKMIGNKSERALNRSIRPSDLPASAFKALKEDEDDVEFLQYQQYPLSLKDIPPGLKVQPSDIVKTLRSFGLREVRLDFSDQEILGDGSFGNIREVIWEDSQLTIAIKCFKVKPDRSNEYKAWKSIVREAQIMSELRHDNILRVFGYAPYPPEENINGSLPYVLVYPAHGNSSLHNYMARNTISEDQGVKIMLDIASALSYMHNPNKISGIVTHGDLRADNVLLNKNGRALLCDFGMSMHSNIDPMWHTRPTSLQTNDAWLAYEFFDIMPPGQELKPTVKSDIYAFGCVCYELTHNDRPYHGLDDREISVRKVRGIPPTLNISDGFRAQSLFKMIMEMCWRVSPARRPSAPKLEVILKGTLSALR